MAGVFEKLQGLDLDYDQITKVAIGGMAEVYRARQKNLDRPVAIKRIRPELKMSKDIQERFRREARSSANLLHQNLAHVYDYKELEDHTAYIIMEYIDGFDLAQILEKTGALPVDVALMIAVKILHGLTHVHAHGMIHRDMKPDNVRVSTRGEVKIMDFGIAFDPSESTLTMPGVLMGSPHYLSPEQIIGAKLDSRVDIFAFGTTLYEMLTGKRPFFETENESLYSRIRNGEYVDPIIVKPTLPVFLSKIIAGCLHVNPDKRFASPARIATQLTEYLARNYSLAFEARIRQFLYQSRLMRGDPSMVEITNKTLSGPKLGLGTRIGQAIDLLAEATAEFLAGRGALKRWITMIGVLAFVLLAIAGWVRWKNYQKSLVPKTDVEKIMERMDKEIENEVKALNAPEKPAPKPIAPKAKQSKKKKPSPKK